MLTEVEIVVTASSWSLRLPDGRLLAAIPRRRTPFMLPVGTGCPNPIPPGSKIHLIQVGSIAMADATHSDTSSGQPDPDGRAEEVREYLRAVVDPELGDTIVDLGMVRGIAIEGGDVTVRVALTIAACPLRNQIERDVVSHVQSLDWVQSVRVDVAAMDADERAAVMARARWKAREDAPETAVPVDARVLAIAS